MRVLLVLTMALETVAASTSFDDFTDAAGIAANHQSVYLVTGQSWGDLDGDGFDDLYLTSSAGPNSLWRNLGDGTFDQVDTGGLLELADQISGGASIADFDNDGREDLLVLSRGAPSLFRNLGGWTFEEVAESAGLSRMGDGESAAWADYDRDGDLDLYIVHWYYLEQAGLPESRDVLYRNEGDGSFTDVTDLLDDDRTRGPGFAATWFDFDNDGDDDLYVVNDKGFGNLLWRNDGAGCAAWCFTDISVASGAHRPADSMGVAFGDYDRDGDFDLAYSGSNELVLLQSQVAQGSETFIEVTAQAGVAIEDGIGWATILADFDNDGWLDFFANIMDSQDAARNRLFINNGDGSFGEPPAGSLMAGGDTSLGAAASDHDRDGDLDLVLGNFGQDYRMHVNRLDPVDDSGWLQLELTGRDGLASRAVGARIEVELDDGGLLLRQVHAGSGMGGNHTRRLHFGLGAAQVVSVRIVWPDGAEQILAGPMTGFAAVDYPEQLQLIWSDGFE